MRLQLCCPRLLRLLAFFIVVFLVVAAVACLLVERRISHLESAVWERAAVNELKTEEDFLQRIATARILPEALECRASGLLGDLAHHRGDDALANEHYERTMKWLFGTARIVVTKVIPAFFVGDTDFAHGFTDYGRTPTPLPPVNDADLEIKPPMVRVSDENWRAYLAVPALKQEEAQMIRDTLESMNSPHPADRLFVIEICARHQKVIDALCRLPHPLFPVNVDEMKDIQRLPEFVRLLLLDALQRGAAENNARTIMSLDAAFNLLDALEQNPSVDFMLVSFSLRSELVTLLESERGEHLRPFFREEYRLPAAIWDRLCASEYQAMKRITADTMSGPDPMASRLRTLVLTKHAEFWNKNRLEGAQKSAKSSIQTFQAAWFFGNRRVYQHASIATYAEGRQAAAEYEDFVAEIVHRVGLPLMGSLHQDIAALRVREAVIVSKDVR